MALKRFQDIEQIGQDVDLLTRDIERLRKIYEQYFMGLIKENPEPLRQKVHQLVRKNHGIPIQNARLKFRYQQLISRFNTYCSYWDRILRRIEEGTYQRDVFKSKLKSRDTKATATAPSHAPKHSEDMYQLYQNFQTAKDSLAQPLDHVSFKKFQNQLNQQKSKLQAKHKDHQISFKITRDKGKVKITPVAVKKKT